MTNLCVRAKSWVLLCLAVLSIGISSAAMPSDLMRVGWVEKVQLEPERLILHAKIDTGADHSSLDVEESVVFLREGKKWVRFVVENRNGRSITLERKVYRFVRIKRKGTVAQRRPVVLLNLCLGSLYRPNVQINLTDRSGFEFNMLIGRSFLAGYAVVDPSETYLHEPHCHVEPEK
ncbi:MAG: hypothetical protein D6690_06065 [Nitrospirae bacterium]|nr:MAG: hypothetical protein D6690_06065 [Nitrospirota bacterium]